jgi:hypothetical protein
VEFDGERRVDFVVTNGEREKRSQVVFPVQIYREIFKEGYAYERGDVVTFGGNQWVALRGTMEKPGNGCKDWRLAVRAGRDGRDGAKGEKGEKGEPGRPGRDLTRSG